MKAPLDYVVPGDYILGGDMVEEVEGFGETVMFGVSREHDGVKGNVRGRDLVEEGAGLV